MKKTEKTNFFQFTDHSSKIPLLTEEVDRYNGWYKLGPNNRYYDYLLERYKNSNTTASIIDNIVSRIVGTGFQSDNEVDKTLIDKYKLNEWLKKSAKDLCIFGGYSTKVQWNLLHEKILDFSQYNINNVRVGLMEDDKTEPTLYYCSPYFSQYVYSGRNPEIDVMYHFDEDPSTDASQLLYNFGLNRVGNDVYPTPDWKQAVCWCEVDESIGKYYMNLIHNNFMVNNILVIPTLPNEEEREAFEESMKQRFTGESNAASTMIVYAPSDASEPKLINVGGLDAERKYEELSSLTIESISRAMRLPSPMIAGLSLPGNLFGISDMPTLEVFLNKNTIYPKRALIKADFDKINKYLAQPLTQYTIGDDNVFNQGTN